MLSRVTSERKINNNSNGNNSNGGDLSRLWRNIAALGGALLLGWAVRGTIHELITDPKEIEQISVQIESNQQSIELLTNQMREQAQFIAFIRNRQKQNECLIDAIVNQTNTRTCFIPMEPSQRGNSMLGG